MVLRLVRASENKRRGVPVLGVSIAGRFLATRHAMPDQKLRAFFVLNPEP